MRRPYRQASIARVMGDPEVRTLETPAATLELDARGVLWIRLRSGLYVERADLLPVLDAQRTLAPRLTPVVVDTRGMVGMTRDAQKATTGPEMAQLNDCLALLVESPVSVAVSNFFIRLSRPPYPTRLFRSEAEALAWIARVRRSAPGAAAGVGAPSTPPPTSG